MRSSRRAVATGRFIALAVSSARIPAKYRSSINRGRKRVEGPATVPIRLIVLDQAHKSLVQEGGRLQRVIAPLAAQKMRSQLVKLPVDERSQPLQSRLVASAPLDQETGDVVRF